MNYKIYVLIVFLGITFFLYSNDNLKYKTKVVFPLSIKSDTNLKIVPSGEKQSTKKLFSQKYIPKHKSLKILLNEQKQLIHSNFEAGTVKKSLNKIIIIPDTDTVFAKTITEDTEYLQIKNYIYKTERALAGNIEKNEYRILVYYNFNNIRHLLKNFNKVKIGFFCCDNDLIKKQIFLKIYNIKKFDIEWADWLKKSKYRSWKHIGGDLKDIILSERIFFKSKKEPNYIDISKFVRKNLKNYFVIINESSTPFAVFSSYYFKQSLRLFIEIEK